MGVLLLRAFGELVGDLVGCGHGGGSVVGWRPTVAVPVEPGASGPVAQLVAVGVDEALGVAGVGEAGFQGLSGGGEGGSADGGDGGRGGVAGEFGGVTSTTRKPWGGYQVRDRCGCRRVRRYAARPSAGRPATSDGATARAFDPLSQSACMRVVSAVTARWWSVWVRQPLRRAAAMRVAGRASTGAAPAGFRWPTSRSSSRRTGRSARPTRTPTCPRARRAWRRIPSQPRRTRRAVHRSRRAPAVRRGRRWRTPASVQPGVCG